MFNSTIMSRLPLAERPYSLYLQLPPLSFVKDLLLGNFSIHDYIQSWRDINLYFYKILAEYQSRDMFVARAGIVSHRVILKTLPDIAFLSECNSLNSI